LTNGVIDLLFASVQGWQVRDYKTDMTLDAAAYATQLGTYREALKAVGCDLGGAQLVSVRSTD
jgi:ATP-dependent exoDNAse (exonuclease V) beta subunit